MKTFFSDFFKRVCLYEKENYWISSDGLKRWGHGKFTDITCFFLTIRHLKVNIIRNKIARVKWIVIEQNIYYEAIVNRHYIHCIETGTKMSFVN